MSKTNTLPKIETIIPPTCRQLLDEELELVDRKSDDSYRHGSYVTAIYRRDEDGTFWRTLYRLSSDGETNELREGLAKIAPGCVTRQVGQFMLILEKKEGE